MSISFYYSFENIRNRKFSIPESKYNKQYNWTESTKNKVIDLYLDEKMSIAKIAKKMGCGSRTILRLLEHNNLVRVKNRPLADQDKLLRLIERDYVNGEPTLAIARKYNCRSQFVVDVIKNNRIDRILCPVNAITFLLIKK